MTEVQVTAPALPRVGRPAVHDDLGADDARGGRAQPGHDGAESVGAEPAASGRTIEIPDLPYRKLAGFALLGVGGLLVAFLLYLFFFTPLTASRNQQRLAVSGVKKKR